MRQHIGRIVSIALVMLFLLGAGYDFLAYWHMTRPGYVALGILLAAATLWITEAVPLFVTSMFVLFLSIVWLAPTMRADDMHVTNEVFMAQFFSDIILLFLGGFVLSAALHKLRLDEWLALWMIRRTGNSIPNLMLGVMVITAFLSMWLSNTATAAMMLALVIPIIGKLPRGDRYRQALVLSVPFAANVGGLGTPIGSPPNAIAMQYMAQINIAPGFGTWMLMGIPGVVVMLALAWGVLLFLYRGEHADLQADDHTVHVHRSASLYVVLATAAVTVVGWMTSSLHGQSAGTVALIPVLVLFASRILTVRELHAISWDVLLLMGGGLCLGRAMSASGLADWLIDLLPVAGVSVFGLMVIFGVVACAMSSVMSNTATANLIMPIILGLSVEGLSPILVGTAFACSLAMPLPVSTPPNAMAFSSEEITVGDMIKPGLVLTVVGVALAFTAGYWWWNASGVL